MHPSAGFQGCWGSAGRAAPVEGQPLTACPQDAADLDGAALASVSVNAPVAAGWVTKASMVNMAVPAGSGPLALVLRIGSTARAADHYSVHAAGAAPGTLGSPPAHGNGFTFTACERLVAGAAPEAMADCPSLRVTAATYTAA